MVAYERGLRRRAVLAAGVLAGTALLGTAAGRAEALAAPAGAAAAARPRAELPAPTGPYAVGTATRHLVDASRRDPWKPESGDREVMASLFYPAGGGGHGRTASHMDAASAAHFGAAGSAAEANYRVRAGAADWAATRTHARVDAPVARGARSLPVVLYSAGLGDPRTWNTGLAEELASRGYVVVTIDHTYDSSEVAFPGGRLAESVLPALAKDPGTGPREIDAALRRSLAARVGDARFVLDVLGGDAAWRRAMPRGLADAMDLRRVGMTGHSMGGLTAAQTMLEDRRVRAGVNMDGQLAFPLPDASGSALSGAAREGVDRPFLLLGSEGPGAAENRPSWTAFRQHSRGWNAELTMAGSRHGAYTDAASLLPALSRQGALSRADLKETLGTVRPERAVAATRAYTVAFFDRFLRGRDGGLLDGPSTRFPEMRLSGAGSSPTRPSP
ncbi:esterase [Streptomyces sp. HU2014]|uniref:alpha/beta hydrolase family protein n=1 Tax=Streptomyces sp. HU2014 TaxID=2939414 RepID=UPI00200FD54B|nr:esterase [Streptomyces sp. HU2014]UQI43373.1 esterase [Streptomyces sp. HU2014]